MNLHIETIGTGKPLVFIHGWGFDHRVWLPLADTLKTDYQLFLVDLPGSGLSTIMDWSVFRDELLKRLPESFSLIGWSLGGLFATRLALELPQRIKVLISLCSSPYFLKEEKWPGIERKELKELRSKMTQLPELTLMNFLNSHALLYESIFHAFSSSSSGSTINRANQLTKQLDLFFDWDLRPSLASLIPPTYYLFGRYDKIVPRTLLPTLKKRYSNPNFHYVLFEQAAHSIFLSHENEFIHFLKRLSL